MASGTASLSASFFFVIPGLKLLYFAQQPPNVLPPLEEDDSPRKELFLQYSHVSEPCDEPGHDRLRPQAAGLRHPLPRLPPQASQALPQALAGAVELLRRVCQDCCLPRRSEAVHLLPTSFH